MASRTTDWSSGRSSNDGSHVMNLGEATKRSGQLHRMAGHRQLNSSSQEIETALLSRTVA